MKKFIVLIIATAIFILATAQGSQPDYFGDGEGLPVHSVDEIYRVSYTIEIGEDGCKETRYFWVDKFGRFVTIEGFEPKEPFTPEEIIERYLEKLWEENQFYNPTPPDNSIVTSPSQNIDA